MSNEKEQFFLERTEKHVAAVQRFAKLIAENLKDRELAEALMEQVLEHDTSKFYQPEREPYIEITWSYKDGGNPTEDEKLRNQKATEHHVNSNSHHPEYHSYGQSRVNKEDRDAPPEEAVDGSRMPFVDLAEMCADWLAVGEERGNSAIDWADANIGVRWMFTKEQKGFIYEMLWLGEPEE